jgi:hypothetical protein
MATGYDYTGNRMEAADYALRGVGVVLGLLPTTAGMRAMHFGGYLIKESWVAGATFLRSINVRNRYAGLLQRYRTTSRELMEFVGAMAGANRTRAAAVVDGIDRRAIEYYNPSTAMGPLGDVIIDVESGMSAVATFRSGSYVGYETTAPTRLYRVWGGEFAHENGSYWSRTRPAGPLQASLDSALDPSWGNTATSWTEITVPSGVRLFEGVTEQAHTATGTLMGGGNQIFLTNDLRDSISRWITDAGVFP